MSYQALALVFILAVIVGYLADQDNLQGKAWLPFRFALAAFFLAPLWMFAIGVVYLISQAVWS